MEQPARIGSSHGRKSHKSRLQWSWEDIDTSIAELEDQSDLNEERDGAGCCMLDRYQ